MGRFVAQLALGFAFLGVAILLGRGARAIWTFPEDSLLPLMIGLGILMLVVHPFRPRDPVRLDYLDEEPLVACLILGAMMAVFLFLLGVVFGEPLARNAATSVGAGAGIAGGCAVIFGAGRLIERRLARSRGVPVGEFRYRPGRIARPLLVVAGALLVLFFALAIAVEIADVVQLDTK